MEEIQIVRAAEKRNLSTPQQIIVAVTLTIITTTAAITAAIKNQIKIKQKILRQIIKLKKPFIHY